jgi:hypothetical protein
MTDAYRIFDNILTTLVWIDLSKFSFDGAIPESLGRLVSLHVLCTTCQAMASWVIFCETLVSWLKFLTRVTRPVLGSIIRLMKNFLVSFRDYSFLMWEASIWLYTWWKANTVHETTKLEQTFFHITQEQFFWLCLTLRRNIINKIIISFNIFCCFTNQHFSAI